MSSQSNATSSQGGNGGVSWLPDWLPMWGFVTGIVLIGVLVITGIGYLINRLCQFLQTTTTRTTGFWWSWGYDTSTFIWWKFLQTTTTRTTGFWWSWGYAITQTAVLPYGRSVALLRSEKIRL
ncbi:hypothetical protein LSM04_002964 [Trypanosoma melophagium]|uniref:uncharacterized protein n=1 Tax=Trypanosoma melophagium TaxID=715481 RepID=UPI00351A6244|nr:hypothetical protein LSM04_002964 [Trypanosoma melophagium]